MTVLKGLFADETLTYAGSHYRITELDGLPKPVQRPHPPFLIGGGGRRTLSLAGREAQIVGFAPRIHAQRPGDPLSFTLEATAEKVEWVRKAAGGRFDQLTFNVYPSMSQPSLTDNARDEIGPGGSAERMGGAPITATAGVRVAARHDRLGRKPGREVRDAARAAGDHRFWSATSDRLTRWSGDWRAPDRSPRTYPCRHRCLIAPASP